MLRHGKSDWGADYGTDDRLRPLAPRGKRAAQTIGRFLAATDQVPERVLVSPAVRAQNTLEMAMRAGDWKAEVVTCEGLYGFIHDVLNTIRRDGGDAERLMIVGHELAWSRVASILAGGAQFRLPTASVLRLDFDIDDWAAVDGDGQIQWLVTPRVLRAFSKRS